MKKPVLFSVFIFLLISLSFGKSLLGQITPSQIDSLNLKADELRSTSHDESMKLAFQSFRQSEHIKYATGTAEACRLLGTIYQAIGKRDSALFYYSKSYILFKQTNSARGIAQSLNNLGNFYRDFNNDRALYYYNLALEKGRINNDYLLEAGCFMNIGILYNKKEDYKRAFENYQNALKQFQYLRSHKGTVQALINIGLLYIKNNETQKAKKVLEEAHTIAKENELSLLYAKINNFLAGIYIKEKKLKQARLLLDESKSIVQNVDDDLYYDCILNYYHLEKAEGDYRQALGYLEAVNKIDSVYFEESTQQILSLTEEKQRGLQKEKHYELSLERGKYNKTIMIASVIVIFLSFASISLLFYSRKRTIKSNSELQKLNERVSRQKEHMNLVNRKLEEVIAERTSDLLIKNQKLSEFSAHLSHQIRGPIVTMKGLLLLVKDGLITEEECLSRLKHCVEDVDKHIIDINAVLHNPKIDSFGGKNPESGNL